MSHSHHLEVTLNLEKSPTIYNPNETEKEITNQNSDTKPYKSILILESNIRIHMSRKSWDFMFNDLLPYNSLLIQF